MSTFDEWYEWARAQGDDWAKVAGNARRGARYAGGWNISEFQTLIGAAFPQTCNAYNAACLPHHLRGEEVAKEHLPAYLTRMVCDGHLTYTLERVAGGHSHPTPAPARLSQTRWAIVADFLPSRENADQPLFVPARALDETRPEQRAVFATFDEADGAPANNVPSAKFLERVRSEHGPAMTVADYAVYRLATESRPKEHQPTSTKVLLHYPCERVGAARFPVPADPGWHPRFRAIAPGDPHYCGRTFPDGSDPAEHMRGLCGENEVVHGNRGIPCSEVYALSLGETSCGRA